MGLSFPLEQPADRNREFIGQDIDLRCVRITGINLALRNLYGYVLWGDSLGSDVKRAFRTGFNGKGFVADIAASRIPTPIHEVTTETVPSLEPAIAATCEPSPPRRQSQLRLF